MFRLALCLASLGVIAACGADTGADRCVGLTAAECLDPGTGLPTGNDVVVDAEWLLARMGDASLQLVDTRGAAYERSRIPGAVSLVPGDVADTIDGIRGQLVPAELAEPTLRAHGLRSGTTAVVYGGSPEYDPARIVWALRYYGHGDVRYLDGGFDGYVAAGGAVDESAPAVEPSDYAIDQVVESLRVTGDYVREQIGEEPFNDPLIQLVDARSEGEFEAGAIPTARSVNWTRNLSGGVLLREEDLDVLYAGLDRASPVVTYCATGQRGSFAWLTLLALGFDDVALYDGSWTEWSTFE